MKIAISQDVVFAESPGPNLRHRRRSTVLTVDASQVRMWRALSKAETVESAYTLLRQGSGTPEGFPPRELYRFVAVLAGHGLIEIVEDPLAARGLRSLRERGLGPTIVSVVNWTRRRIVSALIRTRRRIMWWVDAAFDRRYGTDTSGRVWVPQLGAEGPSVEHAYEFIPTPTAVFRLALRKAVPCPAGYTFVDYGSGKGRTLLIASELPFRQIIGVEFSPELNRIASRNLRLYRGKKQRCRDIKTLCCDAVDFELPDEDLVLYFWTPFRAPVVKKVTTLVNASFGRHPRRLVVIVYAFGNGYVDLFRRVPVIATCTEIPLPRLRLGYLNTQLFVLTNG